MPEDGQRDLRGHAPRCHLRVWLITVRESEAGEERARPVSPGTVTQLQTCCHSHNMWALGVGARGGEEGGQEGEVGNVNRTLIVVMSPKRHLLITLSKRKRSILARLYKQRRHFEPPRKQEVHCWRLANVRRSYSCRATVDSFPCR